MFSLSSFEKGSSVGPQNSPPGHNNISNRFPVGIPSLGDENQQIRIQLAVHKYNSSSNSSVTNRRGLISPVRHSLLRNSPKAVKNYEGDMEPSLKSEEKSGNRYEGVGTFPTVHLKKSSVRYRPIRRFNEVKVPYPELPVSRFLNHLPELCPDVKSSTRSVLDVLQDLSRKRIHSKDEDDCAKLRPKGLGGDISMDAQAAYKPLFVKKPKVNPVMTRDSTTQTHRLSQGLDGSSPQCGSLNKQNEPPDPRAELRRKLARQYNEISASLSSSVSPSFSTKRKIDKVATTTRDDDQQNESSALKKQKVLENHMNSHQQNGISKFVDSSKTNSDDSSLKVGKKKKLNETNSTSPNKDRLTTIFLDMQNSSPKAQVFQNSSEAKNNGTTAENNVPVLNGSSDRPLIKTTTFGNELNNTAVDSPFDSKKQLLEKSGDSLTQSPQLNFVSPGLTTSTPTSSSEKKSNTTELNNPTFKFPVGKASDTSPVTNLSSSPSIQFNFKPPSGSNLNFGTSSFNSSSGNAALGAGPLNAQNASTSSNSTGVIQSGGENKQTGVNKFTFGSSSTNDLKKTDVSTFQFGVENKSSPAQNQVSTSSSNFNAGQKTDQNLKPDALTTTTSNATSSVPAQFSFGSKPNITSTTTTSLSTGGFQFGQAAATNIGVQNAPSSQTKPSFVFGQQKLDNSDKTDDKSETPKANFSPSNVVTTQNSSNTNSSSMFGQNIQSSGSFTFGKKSENGQTLDTGQNVLGLGTSSGLTPSSQTSIFSQSNSILKTNVNAGINNTSLALTSGSTSLSQNSTVQTSSVSLGGDQAKSFEPFTFGQKPVGSETSGPSSTIPVNTSAEQKSQPNFSFGFGQNKMTEAGGFGQKNQTNLFSFGSKTTSQGSEQNNAVPTNALNQNGSNATNSFGQTLNKPINQPSLFGQNASQVSDTAQSTNSAQPNKLFGQSSVPSAGQNTTNFGSKPNIFGTTTTQSITGFGTPTTTQSNSLFGTSTATQSVPAFGASTTTQSIPVFGTSTTTTSAPAFGTATTTQSTSAFGTTTTAQSTFVFGKSATTQSTPIFGTSTTAQSTPPFGATTTTQSTPAFGATTTTQSTPAFGVTTTTQSTPVFGTSTTKQSTHVFGTSTTTQSTPTFGTITTTQSTPVFGTSTTTQSTSVFGTSTTTQSTPTFGTTTTTQSTSVFGTSTTTQPAPVFGTSTTQSSSTFGTIATTQPATGFGGNSVFGTSVPSQAGAGFGAPKGTFGTTASTSSTFGSSAPAFGSSTTTSQSTSGFGSASGFPSATFGTTTNSIQSGSAFGSSSSTQSVKGFGSSSAPQTSFSQTFGQNNNKSDTSLQQTGSIFGQTTVNQNSASGTGFPSTAGMGFNTAENQNTIFGQKTNTQPANVFGQGSKTEASPFNQGSTPQSLGTQNNFPFGMSTSNATGFTSSPPNTTTASVFTFGGNNTTQGTAYNFGGSTASSSSSGQTPFAFGSTSSNAPFKFGASTTKESLGFGGSNTSTFSFGAPMNNNVTSVAQPSGTTFNFGNTQASTPAFSFGSTPSPSVFSFGSSASSTSSVSTFNFGTPQPNAPFGQNATPTPGTPFSVPGTFSIGSGSSQSNPNRPRASTRLRRRP